MTTQATVQAFFEARVPKAWHSSPLAIEFDDDEILCIARLSYDRSIEEFRETTRFERVAIANEAEARLRRKVSWGVDQENRRTLFTTRGAPITTRLRFSERVVLDTLVEAGVARSRADALGWCVKLVARHQAEWLADLRGALVDVERVRAKGPTIL